MSERKTIAVDMDGVIAYHGNWQGVEHFGDPLPGAKEFLTELKKHFYITIFTCRCNPELNNKMSVSQLKKLVVDYLKKNDLPFDDVYTEIGKPIAAAYIDDKAVNCMPQKFGTMAYDMALATLGVTNG
jgi:hypothetical protein